jgi:hypothetical protein
MGCDYYFVEHLRVLFYEMNNPLLIKWKYQRRWYTQPLETIEQHKSTLLYENGEKIVQTTITECDEMCEIIKNRISSLEQNWEDIVSIHLETFIFERY